MRKKISYFLGFIFLIKSSLLFGQIAVRDPFSVPQNTQQAVAENAIIFSDNKITLDFVNVEIQQALQQFAQAVNLNMIVSDTVKGVITVHVDK